MVLSDRTIKEEIAAGRLVFDPYDESLVQPSSVDMRVDRSFRVFNNTRYPYIEVREPMEDLTSLVTVEEDEPFVLHPGEFVLGQTLERVRLPDDLVARLEGKSSLGRLGLVIHSTAGFVDPGFEGNLTLELSNLANLRSRSIRGCRSGRSRSCAWTGRSSTPTGRVRRGASTRGRRSRPRVASTSTSPGRAGWRRRALRTQRRRQDTDQAVTRRPALSPAAANIRSMPNIGPRDRRR